LTTTVTLANAPSSYVDTSIAMFDQTKLLLRKSTVQGKSIKAEYVYNDGDPLTETSVEVTIIPDAKSGMIRIGCRCITVQTTVVDSNDPVYAPIETGVYMNVPGTMADTAKVLKLLNSTVSLLWDGLSTKVPQTGIIDAINRGLITNLYG
jgi:hypothetical protein